MILYGGFYMVFSMDFLFLNGGFFSPQTMVVLLVVLDPQDLDDNKGWHQQPGRPVNDHFMGFQIVETIYPPVV